jgi:gamma-glutamyltranspeptidase/glutathione hydrolase
MKLDPPAKFLLAAALALCQLDTQAASQAPVAGEHGMVVTAQHLATQVGVDVLKAGGNAVDAAVAVGYALAVVYPAAGNLGGGGFMTIELADGRKTFLDFREKAPLAATANMYLDKESNVVQGASTYGHLAVGVPGTVSGMEMARAKYGTMPRAALLAPAIKYAQNGFVLQQGDVDMLLTATDKFKNDPASAAIFLNHGEPYKSGQKLVQHDLAHTLRLISENGADGFYKGTVGSAIVASSKAGNGIITQADLDQYRTRELKPIECTYRGYGIVSAPPPSSGGVALCEMLNILEGYPLQELGYRSAQAVQYQIEAMRHAYADRNSYLGDPDFVNNPVDHLLDKNYAAKIRAMIAPDKAGDSLLIRHGEILNPFALSLSKCEWATSPDSGQTLHGCSGQASTSSARTDLNNFLAGSTDIQSGELPHEGSNTTHYSIIDKWGNAVSVTYTLNDWFGARITAARTGVLLNDEMDDFTIKAGVPNQFGLVQGEANAIAPGKRPLSSMSPTIVTRGGKPVMVLGTPGGSRIITAVLLTILNVIDYGMDMQQAVDAPRFHQQWLPDVTNLEPDAISPETRKTLEGWGQKFGPPQEANHVAAILVGAPSLGGEPVGSPSSQSSPASGRGSKREVQSLIPAVGKNRYYGANDMRRGTGLALGY